MIVGLLFLVVGELPPPNIFSLLVETVHRVVSRTVSIIIRQLQLCDTQAACAKVTLVVLPDIKVPVRNSCFMWVMIDNRKHFLTPLGWVRTVVVHITATICKPIELDGMNALCWISPFHQLLMGWVQGL